MNLIDDPRPAPRLQRAEGEGSLSCGLRDSGPVLRTLRQVGCAKIRILPTRGATLEALTMNSAGGLAGGDRLAWRIAVEAGARASLSSTGCERVYRSLGQDAAVEVGLSVGAGASLDWIPQETILFDQGRLSRRLEADVAPEGRLLVAESTLLGRRAMGETRITGALRESWRVRRGGELIFADEVRLDDAVTATASHPAALAGAAAYAALVLVAPEAERLLTPLRAAIGSAGGASAFDGWLFCRIVAQDGYSLRQSLIPALAVLNPGLDTQRVWSF